VEILPKMQEKADADREEITQERIADQEHMHQIGPQPGKDECKSERRN
jgi:hypothetical protein